MTKEEAIDLAEKIRVTMDKNKGVVTLFLQIGISVNVRIKSVNSSLREDNYTCIISTFTTDINHVVNYSIYEIKDVK